MPEIEEEQIAVCDAVVVELNDAPGLSKVFVAQRYFDAVAALEKLTALRVAVVPAARRRTKITRRSFRFDYDVSIAVIQKIDPTNEDQKAGLQLLAREIDDYLTGTVTGRPRILAQYAAAKFVTSEAPVIYDPERLQKHHVFLAPLTVTYRVFT